MKRITILPALAAAAVMFAACSSDGDATTTTAPVVGTTTGAASSTTSISATSTTVGEPVETAATDATTATASSAVTSTTETAVTESTDAVQALGAEVIDVTVGGSNPTRPTFEWMAPSASAVRYQLVVQTADGTPVWAWTGTDTKTVLGGVERPDNVEGPTLIGPSRVRVYALADDGSLAGVSPWVAVDPAT